MKLIYLVAGLELKLGKTFPSLLLTKRSGQLTDVYGNNFNRSYNISGGACNIVKQSWQEIYQLSHISDVVSFLVPKKIYIILLFYIYDLHYILLISVTKYFYFDSNKNIKYCFLTWKYYCILCIFVCIQNVNNSVFEASFETIFRLIKITTRRMYLVNVNYKANKWLLMLII